MDVHQPLFVETLTDFEGTMIFSYRMTACSFAVSAHGCWSWAAKAARTAIPRFIPGRTWSTCRSLDMRRLGSIRRR